MEEEMCLPCILFATYRQQDTCALQACQKPHENDGV
jgi:hypothetical protein